MKIIFSVVGYVFCVLILFLLIYHRRSIFAFIVSCKNEMRRVIWPTPEKVFEQMRTVLISLFVFSIFFGLVDFLLYRIMDFIF